MLDPNATSVSAQRDTALSQAWLVVDQLCTVLFAVEVAAKVAVHGLACPPWPYELIRPLFEEIEDELEALATPTGHHLHAHDHKKRVGFLHTAWDVNDVVVILA